MTDSAMYPHQIRLHGPWEFQGRRLNVPIDLSSLIGSPVRLYRRFGSPRQIDAWERIWLVPDSSPPDTRWQLNGELLVFEEKHGFRTRRADVTEIVIARNELVAETAAATGSFEGATLEIGCRAHLVSADFESGQIRIGLYSGSADDPLEIYVLIDGQCAGYVGPFSAAGSVERRLPLEPAAAIMADGASMRVDLVCRSAYWDSVEQILQLPIALRDRGG